MLDLNIYDYIKTIEMTGNLRTDIAEFFNTNKKEDTLTHCLAVAKTSRNIAERFRLDSTVAATAALLHDISAVMKPGDMPEFAKKRNWEPDSAEEKYPFLLHQRVSEVFAAELFGVTNPIVLSAISCHTTLKKSPSEYDMILFIADKLSWDKDGTPPFYDLVSRALDNSLIQACRTYINYTFDNKMILAPHHWYLEAKSWLEKYEEER
jgi:predicted HD superfamily hydrolase involved in NAD metabolism